MEFLQQNWVWLAPVLLLVAEKIVRATPSKKDDIIFDMILTPLKEALFKKGVKNGTKKTK